MDLILATSLALITSFTTGYLLCLYNSKTEKNIWKHGIREERPQPQIEDLEQFLEEE